MWPQAGPSQSRLPHDSPVHLQLSSWGRLGPEDSLNMPWKVNMMQLREAVASLALAAEILSADNSSEAIIWIRRRLLRSIRWSAPLVIGGQVGDGRNWKQSTC